MIQLHNYGETHYHQKFEQEIKLLVGRFKKKKSSDAVSYFKYSVNLSVKS